MDPWSDFEDGYISTSLGEVFYRLRPSTGVEVTFLHGLGASIQVWSRLFPLIPEEIGIFAIDLLGHGRSDAPKIDYDIMVQVKMLEEVVRHESMGAPTIFGHSYGAWIAAHYAARNRTPGIILEDPAGLPDTAVYEDPVRREEFFQLVTKGDANREAMRSIVDHSNTGMMAGDLLSKISCRTLILWGSRDSMVDPKLAPKVQSEIKGSSLLMIDGADHNPHYSNAGEVAKAITDFLSA